MTERVIVVVTAFLLDIILGDPQSCLHPIRVIGSLIAVTEKTLTHILKLSEEREADRGRKLFAGVLLLSITVFISVFVPAVILHIAGRIAPYLKIIAEIIMCYSLLAMKSLKTESMKVYHALRNGNIELAKRELSMIVGRDTQGLSAEGITKAAVETVAENTSDGVIAPLFYIFIFGAAGGFLYKAVNTLDSMTGYKNDRYIYLGRASAYADDMLNFIPSRLSAMFMLISAFILRLDFKNALCIFLRDRRRHSSPNSAMTESVCAGALSVALGGDSFYFGRLCHKPIIGDNIRSIEPEDIKRANNLLYASSLCALLFGVAVVMTLGRVI